MLMKKSYKVIILILLLMLPLGYAFSSVIIGDTQSSITNNITTNITTNISNNYTISTNPLTSYMRYAEFETTAINGDATGFFSVGAIASGTVNFIEGNYNHIGIINITAVSNGINSGYYIQTPQQTVYLLDQGYYSKFIFYPQCRQNIINKTTARIGFSDSNSATRPTDGVFIDVNQTNTTHYNITFIASNNSVITKNETYQISCDSWYRTEIYINNTDMATMFLFNSSLNLINSQVVYKKIPFQLGRSTGLGVLSLINGNATTSSLGEVLIDYIEVGINRTLIR